MPTESVENYLKAILHLHEEGMDPVTTTAISGKVGATAASTSAMLTRLGGKGWLEHKRYHGASV